MMSRMLPASGKGHPWFQCTAGIDLEFDMHAVLLGAALGGARGLGQLRSG